MYDSAGSLYAPLTHSLPLPHVVPMLFVDDEFIGSAEQIFELNEGPELREILNY